MVTRPVLVSRADTDRKYTCLVKQFLQNTRIGILRVLKIGRSSGPARQQCQGGRRRERRSAAPTPQYLPHLLRPFPGSASFPERGHYATLTGPRPDSVGGHWAWENRSSTRSLPGVRATRWRCCRGTGRGADASPGAGSVAPTGARTARSPGAASGTAAVLLTTPESLAVMCGSPHREGRDLLHRAHRLFLPRLWQALDPVLPWQRGLPVSMPPSDPCPAVRAGCLRRLAPASGSPRVPVRRGAPPWRGGLGDALASGPPGRAGRPQPQREGARWRSTGWAHAAGGKGHLNFRPRSPRRPYVTTKNNLPSP
jgi:hypothetical protein